MPHDWKRSLDAIVADSAEELVALRRHLHAHPEPSGAELETSLLLYQRLDDAGLPVRMGPEGCGVIADSASPASDGAGRVAVRGDIDALRIHDEKLVPYRSTRSGLMHACGHDAHAAMATFAAIALQRLEAAGQAPWPLCWRAILQPAEETAAGARAMIAAGALEGVKSIFALHADPTRRVGEIGVRTGAFTAHCDAIRIAVRGRGGHGARPHESHDPIAAAAQLISTLYQFVPRANDSLDAIVLSFGRLAGGENANVIPEEVQIEGTLRTLDASVRRRTMEQIHQVIRGVEAITGTQIEIAFGASIPSVFNDADAVRLISEAAADDSSGIAVRHIPRPSMGSEDFACFLQHRPGAMFRLGVARDLAAVTALHTPTFDIDERALPLGAKLLARTVVLACQPAAPTDGA
ncbi:MAG: amidohydrolase [Planctomycetota bacterium]|nr:MAG: amidohydrolase [Planctomycetota bacterium]